MKYFGVIFFMGIALFFQIYSSSRDVLDPRTYIASLGDAVSSLHKLEMLVEQNSEHFPKKLFAKDIKVFKKGDFRGILYFLKKGLNNKVDTDGSTFLHFACKLKVAEGPVQWVFKKELIKYLLFLGFDLNAQNNKGKTPLYYAVKRMLYYQDVDNVVILLHAGADPTLVDKKEISPLYLLLRDKLCRFDSVRMESLIDLFFQKKADPFYPTQNHQLSPYFFIKNLKKEIDCAPINRDIKLFFYWFIKKCKKMKKCIKE